MEDIDYAINTNDGFSISFSDNPRRAVGNKALVNRFEITFLTSTKSYLVGEDVVADDFGGDADRFVGQTSSLSNSQSIASSITIAVDKTVESILENQININNTKERLSSAELVSLEVIDGTIYAQIEIVPEEYELSYPLYYSLPLRSV